MDPQNPDVLYVSSVLGVFKSVDAGSHFAATARGIQTSFLFPFVLTVAVDPARSNTLLAGTDFSGVYRSLDGGRTWDSASFGLSDPFHGYSTVVNDIAIDPRNPTTVFAATLDGVYKSLDGGCSWTRSSQGLVESAPGILYLDSISIDPNDSSVIYAVTFDHGVYKSSDGGAQWSPAHTGLPLLVGPVVIDPRDSSTLYTTFASGSEVTPVGTGRVYRSRNAGASWSPLSGLADIGYNSIAIDPGDSSTLYVGSQRDGAFKSIDGGTTWNPAGAGLEGTSVREILVSPRDRQKVFASTSLGLVRSDDAGGLWRPVGDGLVFMQSAVAVDPTSSGTVYTSHAFASVQGTGIQKSEDGGLTWSTRVDGLSSPRSVTSLAVDPHSPSTIYAGNWVRDTTNCHPVSKSIDGGLTWAPSDTKRPPFCAAYFVVIDPSNPARVLAADTGVYESTDAGATWTQLVGLSAQSDLEVDPSDPAVVYGLAYGYIYKSVDGGLTASGISLGSLAESLALKPGNPAFLYAGTVDRGVFKSLDAGQTWSPSGTSLSGRQVVDIVFDPANPQVAYALVVGGGVWRTPDDGATWTPFGSRLEEAGPVRLAIDSGGRRLFAATSAGVYDLEVSSAAAPELLSVDPGSGSAAGGAAVTVHGDHLTAGAMLSIGGTPASSVTVGSDSISAILPPGRPGVAAVRVTNPDTQFDENPSGFVYDFLDVPPEEISHDAVVHLASRGVTVGCGGGDFCPRANLNRASLAALLEKSLHPPEFPYPLPGTSLSDVESCDPFAKYIYELEAEGVSLGCGPSLFCPEASIRRDQIAGFLARALAGGDANVPSSGSVDGTPYDCSGGASHFADVPAGADFCRHVNYLAALGIAIGCDAVPDFCPADLLARGDAAIFLDRAFGGAAARVRRR
jgi:photosystem II stability/assembly factor-like uncharacterized protein